MRPMARRSGCAPFLRRPQKKPAPRACCRISIRLQRWEISQPGNVLRVFERGGEKKPELGIPSPEEDSGAPDIKLSDRGFGTELRHRPGLLGIAENASARSSVEFSGDQRAARRLPRQRLLRMPRHLRQRPLGRNTQRSMRSMATTAPASASTRPSTSPSRAIRCSMSSPKPFHRVNAWSAMCTPAPTW